MTSYRFTLTAGFDQWRPIARRLLAAGVEPSDVVWLEPGETPPLGAMRDTTAAELASLPERVEVRVPRAFLPRARRVACIRGGEQWPLMYRLLFRLKHGEPHLLRDEADEEVHRFEILDKQVRHDVHRMHAFVRFRRFRAGSIVGEDMAAEAATPGTTAPGERDHYVAWHRPDHRVLRLAVPFFVGRFAAMRWSILTPDESVYWDPGGKGEPRFTRGVDRRDAPTTDDALEALWCDYYAAVFNPARANPRAMGQEMPLRFQHHLPELQQAPALLLQASQRVKIMVEKGDGGGAATSAADFIPSNLPEDCTARLAALRAAAAGCRGCDLCCEGATQTVFGEGPADAPLVLLGEQPGDQEDLAGRPFVGPSGQLLDEVLHEVGIDRSRVYMTNTVKHFKFVQRGKLRLHQKPGAREVNACRPWLEAEAATLRPRMLVCLGSTAAQAVLGRDFRVTRQRGEVLPSDLCEWTLATLHPSALLRIPDAAARESARAEFAEDLKKVARRLREVEAA